MVQSLILRQLKSYYKSSSVCLFVCLSVCSLSPPRSFDRSSPNLVGVCRWTSELPLRGSFSKRSTGRRVNGSLSLSTILYICQPHSTQLQKATLLLQHLIRLKGTFCCIDGWWVYLGGSPNCLLDGSSMACIYQFELCKFAFFLPFPRTIWKMGWVDQNHCCQDSART